MINPEFIFVKTVDGAIIRVSEIMSVTPRYVAQRTVWTVKMKDKTTMSLTQEEYDALVEELASPANSTKIVDLKREDRD